MAPHLFIPAASEFRGFLLLFNRARRGPVATWISGGEASFSLTAEVHTDDVVVGVFSSVLITRP